MIANALWDVDKGTYCLKLYQSQKPVNSESYALFTGYENAVLPTNEA